MKEPVRLRRMKGEKGGNREFLAMSFGLLASSKKSPISNCAKNFSTSLHYARNQKTTKSKNQKSDICDLI